MSCLALLLVCFCLLIVCVVCQSSGSGGGTCYENRGRPVPCPTYNYTRYGRGEESYELRTYDSSFWIIENTNATVLPSNYSRPIEGLFATFRPLEDYFFGDNDKKLNISLDTSPVIVAFGQVAEGMFAYESGIVLPPLAAYPPPNPSNSTVTLNGGASFNVYVKEFSPDRSPNNEEIVIAADRFNRQLANDSIQVQNFSIAAFYEPIGAPGNWSKQIWLIPAMSDVSSAWVSSIKHLVGAEKKPIRRSRKSYF